MRPHVLAARALLGWTVVLFAGYYAFEAVNGGSLQDWGDSAGNWVFPLIPLAFAVVGCLVASSHPGNSIGWIALAVGVGGLGPIFPNGYPHYTLTTNPGSLPFAAVSAWMEEWAWVMWVAPAGLFILLFPDGNLVSPRWRWALWFWAFSTAGAIASIALHPGPLSFNPEVRNPFGIEGLDQLMNVLTAGVVLVPLSIVFSAASLVVRWRRSRGETRVQLKWFVASVALVALTHFIATTITYLHEAASRSGFFNLDPQPAAISILQSAALVTWTLIPISAGIAILKYRLYSIDLIINKAVVFGCLAAFVTAAYVGVVVVLGTRLSASSEPNLGLSIIATAVVAVAFQPIKERVQRMANRLVYGRRSTPYEVLARLSSEVGKGYSAEEIALRVARAVYDGTGARRAELWLAENGRTVPKAGWPADDGFANSIEEADAAADIDYEGEHLGALAIYKKTGEPVGATDLELMTNLAAQVALVLRNARLTDELQARLAEISRQAEELRASRERIVTAQDAERRRIERNLHDGAQQRLLTLSLSLRRAEQRLGAETDPEVKQLLAQSAEELKAALTELRELARGIHPAILREDGLSAAVRSLGERSPLPVAVADGDVGRLPGTVEATAYFVVSEALTNVARYSNASKAGVSLKVEDGWLALEVADDGEGGANPANGTGLRGLMDRVSALGGELVVQSSPGRGTVIGARIPCE